MMSTDQHEHPLVSIMLLLLGATSYIVQDISYDSIYIFVFRALSLVSLSFIVLINRKKAYQEFLDIFKKNG